MKNDQKYKVNNKSIINKKEIKIFNIGDISKNTPLSGSTYGSILSLQAIPTAPAQEDRINYLF